MHRASEATGKDVCDTSTHAETMLALSAASREEVDEMVDKALALGARSSGQTMDEGPMYSRDVQDPTVTSGACSTWT